MADSNAAYFHGTDAALRPGDTLVPGQEVDRDNWPGMDNNWGVWLTPYEDIAAAYGSYVYRVEPLDEVIDWCAENGWDRTRENSEYVTTTARIVAVLSAPSPEGP